MMTDFEIGFEIARILVTGSAAAGIWYGIHAMVRANKDRGVAMERMMEADGRRHTEAMRALEALIERTAPASP